MWLLCPEFSFSCLQETMADSPTPFAEPSDALAVGLGSRVPVSAPFALKQGRENTGFHPHQSLSGRVDGWAGGQTRDYMEKRVQAVLRRQRTSARCHAGDGFCARPCDPPPCPRVRPPLMPPLLVGQTTLSLTQTLPPGKTGTPAVSSEKGVPPMCEVSSRTSVLFLGFQ